MFAHQDAKRPKYPLRFLISSPVIVVFPVLDASLKVGSGAAKQLGAVGKRMAGGLELVVDSCNFFQLDLGQVARPLGRHFPLVTDSILEVHENAGRTIVGSEQNGGRQTKFRN